MEPPVEELDSAKYREPSFNIRRLSQPDNNGICRKPELTFAAPREFGAHPGDRVHPFRAMDRRRAPNRYDQPIAYRPCDLMETERRPVPEGYHSATPFLIIRDAAGALDFYKKAFGAKERMRHHDEHGKLRHC